MWTGNFDLPEKEENQRSPAALKLNHPSGYAVGATDDHMIGVDSEKADPPENPCEVASSPCHETGKGERHAANGGRAKWLRTLRPW